MKVTGDCIGQNTWLTGAIREVTSGIVV